MLLLGREERSGWEQGLLMFIAFISRVTHPRAAHGPLPSVHYQSPGVENKSLLARVSIEKPPECHHVLIEVLREDCVFRGREKRKIQRGSFSITLKPQSHMKHFLGQQTAKEKHRELLLTNVSKKCQKKQNSCVGFQSNMAIKSFWVPTLEFGSCNYKKKRCVLPISYTIVQKFEIFERS